MKNIFCFCLSIFLLTVTVHASSISPQAYRRCDIRGKVGNEIPVEETYNLAKAIITYCKEQDPPTDTIIVARDGRLHSPEIFEKVVLAITDLGLDVIDIGLCPTPVFYFATHTLKSPTGIMITASHHPKEYNGFKICINKRSIWGDEYQEIRTIYETKNFF